MCGFIAQLVEHRTGIAEVMGSNPVEALIFFRLLLSNCLNWRIYCDDHTSLLFYVCLPFISYIFISQKYVLTIQYENCPNPAGRKKAVKIVSRFKFAVMHLQMFNTFQTNTIGNLKCSLY